MSMIDGVLNYSSLNTRQQKVTLVDLNKIVSDILIDLELLIERSEAEVTFKTLPSIEGFEVLLYQLSH